MSTALELQQQILQAETSLNELRERLKQENNAERHQAVMSVKQSIQKFGLTAAELGLNPASGKASSKSQKNVRTDKGGVVKPKYVDPTSGVTWTGRGRMPVWLAARLSEGQKKEDYLIAA